jgi:hypothetical protein
MGTVRVLLVLLVVAGAGAHAQAPPADPVQATIVELKRKALAAEDRGQQDRALEYYEQILHLDPDDRTALEQRRSLRDAIAARKQAQDAEAMARAGAEASRRQIRGLLDRARTAVAEAGRTGRATQLRTAEEALASARDLAATSKLAEFDRDLDTLTTVVGRERERQRRRWWEFWGGIGVLVLAGLVAGFFLVWRRPRTLEMIQGPVPGQVFVLRQPTTRVGAQSAEVDWTITDPRRRVSRHHLDVIRNGRHYFVIDHSTNGTFVNGRPLSKGEPVLLKRGDQLGLGGDIVLLFR